MLISSNKVQVLTRSVNKERLEQINPNLNPIIRRIYATRGLVQKDHSLKHLKPPISIVGIEEAVEIVIESIVHEEQICVVGDYDVDGATSTVLLVEALSKLGANMTYLIPNRMIDGYGLTPQIAAKVKTQFPGAKLIITVDNGISSIEGVEFAKRLGLKVIITDHHLPAEQLPEADGIVNPNLSPNHPLKNLAGVGVSFYFLCALIEQMKSHYLPTEGVNPKQYLDLVALGTVADCVKLDYNNRILVLNGIEVLKSKSRVGVSVLMEGITQIQTETLNSTDIAFYLAPTINAAGRLEEMSVGVECLLSQDPNEARSLATKLIAINKERKEKQALMQQSAADLMKTIEVKDEHFGYCFYSPKWHEGISGILASKLKENLLRPVIVFAQSNDENILKGSARSVDSIHIKDVLESIAVKHPDLILGFGGHAMAAGLQIKKENFLDFDREFLQALELIYSVQNQPQIEKTTNQTLKTVIHSDGELNASQINSDLAIELANAACWGSGVEYPMFHGHFTVRSKEKIKEEHIRLKLSQDEKPGIYFPAICFGVGDHFDEIGEEGEAIFICYQLDINKYNNSLQLIIRYIIQDD